MIFIQPSQLGRCSRLRSIKLRRGDMARQAGKSSDYLVNPVDPVYQAANKIESISM